MTEEKKMSEQRKALLREYDKVCDKLEALNERAFELEVELSRCKE